MATFVLVHGAWHGSWCWSRVQAELVEAGHTVVCPDLPSDVASAGGGDYLVAVRKVLTGLSDAVLVAHSMAALVAPFAAQDDAVGRLVLLAGLVPHPDSTWLDHAEAGAAPAMRRLSARMRFDDRFRSSWDPADATELFYQDCPPADAAEAVSRMRPDSSVIYGEVCPELPARPVPTVYVSCRQDQAVDGAWNAAAARELLDADVLELATGHSPFWSHPADLAQLLTDVAPERRSTP